MTELSTTMPIASLIVTQKSVRKSDSLTELVKHAKDDGRFTGICIFAFEDGKYYLHDGHHRVAAIYMSGRDFLDVGEYVVIQSTYSAVASILFDKSFVTPYDPRTEMRLANFGAFKQHAMALFNKGDTKEATSYVIRNKHLYATKRTIHTVEQLVAGLNYKR